MQTSTVDRPTAMQSKRLVSQKPVALVRLTEYGGVISLTASSIGLTSVRPSVRLSVSSVFLTFNRARGTYST